MIPLNERHLPWLLIDRVAHYYRDRPCSSLGPGILHPSVVLPVAESFRHQIPRDHCMVAKPILGGRHHEYWEWRELLLENQRDQQNSAQHFCGAWVEGRDNAEMQKSDIQQNYHSKY